MDYNATCLVSLTSAGCVSMSVSCLFSVTSRAPISFSAIMVMASISGLSGSIDQTTGLLSVTNCLTVFYAPSEMTAA